LHVTIFTKYSNVYYIPTLLFLKYSNVLRSFSRYYNFQERFKSRAVWQDCFSPSPSPYGSTQFLPFLSISIATWILELLVSSLFSIPFILFSCTLVSYHVDTYIFIWFGKMILFAHLMKCIFNLSWFLFVNCYHNMINFRWVRWKCIFNLMC